MSGVTTSSKWFVNPQNVDRIMLDDGEWVDIKRKLSIGDRDTISNKLVELEIQPQQRQNGERRKKGQQAGNITGKVRPSTVALLQVAIVDWSFLDENNNKLPITEEVINLMSTELADILEQEVDGRNPL